MAFPKKQTHRITVGATVYLWHRSSKWESQLRWTAIRKQGIMGQVVLVDPYSHDLSAGAGGVRKAIDFALAHGWTPDHKGNAMKLRYNEDGATGEPFTVLPPDARPGIR